jgi:hypothetical protein
MPRLTTTQRGLGTAHQKQRARLLAALVDGTPCPRINICGGLPMYRTPAAAEAAGLPRRYWNLNADHVIPRAIGGRNGPLVLTHEHCNKSAGRTLGNKIRSARRRAVATQAQTRW